MREWGNERMGKWENGEMREWGNGEMGESFEGRFCLSPVTGHSSPVVSNQ
jgi:hypothetical protein